MQSKKTLFLILSIGLIIYTNTFSSQFVWDDQSLVVKNDYIRSWRNIGRMFSSELRHFSPEQSNYYRPLQTISYAIDYTFWQLDPFGYHLTNLLLHLLCTYLVYLVLKLFFTEQIALFSSLLFLVHPLNTQVVSYISGRADSLAALFFLCSFYLFIRSLCRNNAWLPCYIFSLFFYLLALLSKESSIVFASLFFLYLIILRKQKKDCSLWNYFPYFIFSLGYIFLRLTILDFSKGAKVLFLWQDTPLLIRIIGFGKVVLSYLGILFFPFNLHLEYTLAYPDSLLNVGMLLSAFILIVIVLIFFKSWRLSRRTFFFLSWFFMLMLPTANIIIPLGVAVSAHWLYLASVGGFCLLCAFLIKLSDTKIKPVRLFIGSIIFLMIAGYGWLTINQNANWGNNLKLYLYELKYSPDNCVLHNNLGNEYRKRRLYLQAEKHLRQAIALNPKYPLAYNNLGLVYLEHGAIREAIANFQQAANLQPGLAQIQLNLGLAYQIEKRFDLSERHFTQALALDPHFVPSYLHLGSLFKQQGNLDKARFYWQEALGIDPDNAFIAQALEQLAQDER